MSIMISVAQQLQMKRFVKMTKFVSFVTSKLFPGAVTLVLSKGSDIPAHYFPEMDTVGLRVPLHNATQDILSAFKGPLITTSANPSGAPLCFTHEEVVKSFSDSPVKPDLVFEGKANHFDLASTVLEVKEENLKVIRQGPVTAAQLESILGFRVQE